MYYNRPDKYLSSLTLVIVLITVVNSSARSQTAVPKWKLDKKKNGIEIYLRKHSDTGLKEVKGVMELHTSLSAVLTLLKDLEKQKTWMYANKSSKLLQSKSHFHWILYTVSDAPWPFQDRDLISEAHMKQDNNCSITISIKAKPEYIAENENYVRIKYMHSEWRFIPKDNGIVKIQFKIRINLGGNLPIWAMNMAVDKGPYNTLIKMREQLQSNKYKNAKLNYLCKK